MDDLRRDQRHIGRSLGKARAGEDRELARRVREGGEALASVLAGLLKLTRVHAVDNRAFDAPVAELVRSTAELHGLVGAVRVQAVDDQVFVNEIRLRSEGHQGLRDLGTLLRKHNVGGLVVHVPLDAAQVRALVLAFAEAPEEPHPRTALRRRLAAEGLGSLELHGILHFRTSEDLAGGASDADGALERCQGVAADAWLALAGGRVFDPLPLRRAVAELIELGPLSPALWDGWVRRAGRRTHALGVALHVLAMGEGAGLPRGVLQDVGVAALVHDVGYAALGGGAELSGPDGLARHPGEGARVLLRQRGFSDAKVRRLRAVLDHHRAHVDPRGRTSTVGSLLRVAEDYSCLLRVHGARVTAAEVLGAMGRAAGAVYHPVLVQLLVNAMGAHPPGTLLELADGRRARSSSPVRSPGTFATPLVRLLDPAGGEPTGPELDLASGPAVLRALPG